MMQWRRGILLLIVALMAVIQVLPQVDLPDTTSHENDVPVVEKARLRLTTISLALAPRIEPTFTGMWGLQLHSRIARLAPGAVSLPVFHAVLLC